MYVLQEHVCNYIEFIHSKMCSVEAKFYSLSSSRLPLLSELWMR